MQNAERLWQAVLNHALIDAIREGDFSYFTEDCKDFREVCDNAEINYKWLLNAIETKQTLPIKLINYKRRVKRGMENMQVTIEINYHDYWSID